jgi:hypothetical protein
MSSSAPNTAPRPAAANPRASTRIKAINGNLSTDGSGKFAMARTLSLVLSLVILSTACVATGAQPGRRPAAVAAFHPPGESLRRLPRGNVRISVGTTRYHYYDGMFFEPMWPGYVVVSAPIGAHVRTLPRGYVSFAIGPRSYFYVNSTFFLWDDASRDYVVVEEPAEASSRLDAAQAPTDSPSLFVYPNQGQDQALTQRDRYDCHLWAADQSGYDPTYSNQNASLQNDYRRAMTACLEGRGYTVR